MLSSWRSIKEATAASHALFTDQAKRLESTQHAVLMAILESNRNCLYGRQYDFSSIKNAIDYQAAVPIVHYDDIDALVHRQGTGEKTICSESILFYEETSGSDSGRKRLPYTRSSLSAMQQAINTWLFDLSQDRPGVTTGPSYWSISPMGREPACTSDGTPVGAPSDLSFLAESIQAPFVDLMAVPPTVAAMTDRDEWRYHTLFALIANARLAMMSVWSPSFLTELIGTIPQFTDRLIRDLTTGVDNCSLDEAFRITIQGHYDSDNMLARIVAATHDGRLDTTRLWPNLDTISCWTQGSAYQSYLRLRRYFPKLHFQGKGLLATEAVISIPLSGCDSPVLAAGSAFFEFIDSDDRLHLAHELEIGCTYEVLLTTFGGLYRYALGDTVKVNDYYHDLPMLEFMGRSGVTSDLCGEKLNDAFVTECLRVVSGFSLLAPTEASTGRSGYCLYVDAITIGDADASIVCRQVESALQSNPQYAYARRLDQLENLSLQRVASLQSRYIEHCIDKGQILGDIKPVSLSTDHALIDHLQFNIVSSTHATSR